jgi:hypothetical protein
MISAGTSRLTADRIIKVWDQGFPVDPRALHFIESTFGLSRTEEIIAVLNDPRHEDRETLMQIIFFPDESVLLELEPIVEEENFTETDISRLVGELISGFPVIRVVFPVEKQGIGFNALPGDIESFVSRLNLGRLLHQRLVDVMKRHPNQARYYKARVKLKNSRLKFTENQVRWLASFFGCTDLWTDNELARLAFALEVLHQAGDEEDIYRVFMDLKKMRLGAIDRYRRFMNRLEKSNMETLMFSGVRAPYIDEKKALKSICFIDDICLGIYGKTDPAGVAVHFPGDLGIFDPDSDLADLIRIFS